MRLSILNAGKKPARDVGVSMQDVGVQPRGRDWYERVLEDMDPVQVFYRGFFFFNELSQVRTLVANGVLVQNKIIGSPLQRVVDRLLYTGIGQRTKFPFCVR